MPDVDAIIEAIEEVTEATRAMRDSFRAIAADIAAQPIEVMTLAKLRAMEEGQGEYFGGPYVLAARTFLTEIREAWPYIKDATQRRAVQAGILPVMDEIAGRRLRHVAPEWARFREECMELIEDWNVVWALGDAE